MKRMHPFIAFILGTLLGAGAMAFRNALRNAPEIQEPSGPPSVADAAAVDRLQSEFQIDTAGKYELDPADLRLLEKLQQESLRQRPEDRRN